MYVMKNLFRKSTSLIVSIGILLSALVLPIATLFSNAENTCSIVSDNYTRPADNETVDAELSTSKNLLYNMPYSRIEQYKNGSKTTVNSAYPGSSGIEASKIFTSARLGKSGGLGQISGKVYFDSNGDAYDKPDADGIYSSPLSYTDLVYNIGIVSKIDSIVVYQHSPAYATYVYQVYVSSNNDTLFDADSMCGQFINTNNETRQKFNFSSSVDGQYIGIRFLIPVNPTNTTAMSSPVVRLSQVAAFGTRGEEPAATVEKSTFTSSTTAVASLCGADNLIYNREYGNLTQYSDGIEKANADTWLKANPKGLTDGTTHSQGMIYNGIYFNADGTPKNVAPYDNVDSYTTLTYYLGGIANVTSAQIYNHSKQNLTTYAYQIYLSESYASLYSKESLKYTFVNDKSTLQTFTFKSGTTAKYFGVKFLVSVNPSLSSSDLAYSSRYLRLSQIAVFGEVTKQSPDEITSPVTTGGDMKDYTEKYGSNMLKTLNASAYYEKDGNRKSAAFSTIKNITDEDFATGAYTGSLKFADWNNGDIIWYDSKDRYVEVYFDLQSEASINAALVVNHKTEALRTNHYALYLSNDLGKLYDDESEIVNYTNSAKDQKNTFEFSTPKLGRYFAIRVFFPTSDKVASSYITESTNSIVARINELAIFGSYTDKTFFPTINTIKQITSAVSDSDFAAEGTNLLKNYSVKVNFNGMSTSITKKTWVKEFTDGIISKHKDVVDGSSTKLITSDGSNYMDFVYDFGEDYYDLDGFAFAGICKDYQKAYYTGWYQVYAATDIDELFNSENMIYEYNWLNDELSRGIIAKFDNYTKRCNCFAVRINNAVTTATTSVAVRLAEIAAYGKKAIIPTIPTNLAANMPLNVYTANKSESLTDVTNSVINVSNCAALTNGSTDDKVTFNKTGKLVLYYNLCNDVNLSEVNLLGNIKKYKAYAASEYDNIWNESSLLYSYTGPSSSTALKTSTINARYVKFVIEDYDPSQYISEVSIIGLDNQIKKSKKFSRSISASNVYISEANNNLDSRKFLITSSANTLFDSDLNTPLSLMGGKNNEIPLDVNVYFGDLKTVNNISLDFPKNKDGYNPTKVEIYASERIDAYDEIQFDDKPIKVFTGLPKNGVYEADFVPFLARCILVRIVCGNKEYDGYENTMNIALNEISISGTSVTGTQRDEDNNTLLSFTDKPTGLTMNILKSDNNDIYNAPYKFICKSANLTTAEKNALAQSNLVPIDGKKYRITLVDINGNELNDFGGRTAQLATIFNASKYSSPSYCSFSSSGAASFLETDYTVENGNNTAITKMIATDNDYITLAVYDNNISSDSDINNNDLNNNDSNNNGSNNDDSYTDNGSDNGESSVDGVDNNNEYSNPDTGSHLPYLPIAVFAASIAAAFVFGKRTGKTSKNND